MSSLICNSIPVVFLQHQDNRSPQGTTTMQPSSIKGYGVILASQTRYHRQKSICMRVH
ncbi:MAG: hypothetical protein MUE99_11205 [Chitinophagaceae bacterium]|nr:hypothetical protein [Chitinophagaceae bacterium]